MRVDAIYPSTRQRHISTSTSLWYYASETVCVCVRYPHLLVLGCYRKEELSSAGVVDSLSSLVSSLNMRTGSNQENAICRLHFERICSPREAVG